MKKIINYFKRFYQCLYKFDLYRDYFKEPKILALLFVVPMFIGFSWITYQGAVTNPELIKSSFDPYYEILSNTTYEEVIDFDTLEDDDVQVKPDENINIKLQQGVLSLNQTKVLDKTIKSNDLIYHLIIDTQNEYGISIASDEDVTSEVSDALTLGKQDMLIYATADALILELDGRLMFQNFSDFDINFESIDELYDYLKKNFYDKRQYITFAMTSSLILFSMYYFVNYFVMRSLLKRHGFELSTGRKFSIIFYTMQPGLYVYFILSLILGQSSVASSFVVPLGSALTMMLINTKTIDHVKDYVKKEQKAEKRLKRNQ